MRRKVKKITESYTWISGSIPFPKMAAIMEIEVKALKVLEAFEDSNE